MPAIWGARLDGDFTSTRRRPEPRSIEELADALCKARPLAGAVVHRQFLPATGARYAEPDDPPHPSVRAALAAQGIPRLYSHQAAGLSSLAGGHDLLTVTPTASGKSLLYILPTLEAVLADPDARALYLSRTRPSSRISWAR